MKENSIEEALEKLSTGKKIKMYELLRTFKKEGIENFVITRKKYVDVILSDYKRVLKENEEYKKAIDVVNKEKEDWIRAYQEEKDKQFDFINKISSNDLISVQKVKDKISERQFELQQEYKDFEDDAILIVLQELLEGRK